MCLTLAFLNFRFLEELVKFVACLHQKEDVLILVEVRFLSLHFTVNYIVFFLTKSLFHFIFLLFLPLVFPYACLESFLYPPQAISCPLLEWLTEMHLLDSNSSHQLQILWSQMLNTLQQSQPSVQFDSSFLHFQAPLFERAIDHPNPAISEATTNFWNSTYGLQSKLDFPKTLVPTLDKLSRNGKLKICGKNQYTEACTSSVDRYKVTSTLKKCSKRVEILNDSVQGSKVCDDIHPGAKRKRVELTERQKEVRRAQQGRARDSNGHGPGIRTYTDLDFSQGNEESQDSQRF